MQITLSVDISVQRIRTAIYPSYGKSFQTSKDNPRIPENITANQKIQQRTLQARKTQRETDLGLLWWAQVAKAEPSLGFCRFIIIAEVWQNKKGTYVKFRFQMDANTTLDSLRLTEVHHLDKYPQAQLCGQQNRLPSHCDHDTSLRV